MDIFPINLFPMDRPSILGGKTNVGDVSGVIVPGVVRGDVTVNQFLDGSRPARELSIPWDEMQDASEVFTLLRWRTAVSAFAGREAEIHALYAWATAGPEVSAKFLTGEGGMGKSRLAAELAKRLREDNWAAGFADLRKPDGYFARRPGTLLLIDYPEENREAVRTLLQDFSGLEDAGRLRLLFLSRRPYDDWRELVHDSGAAGRFDPTSVELAPLAGEGAYRVFCSAQERAAETLNTVPLSLSEEAFLAWLELAPENARPLFIVATAIYSAIDPQEPAVRFIGREVISALVERELTRLRRISEGSGLDREALGRLLAAAAIRGTVDRETLGTLASAELGMRVPDDLDRIEDRGPSGIVMDGAIPAPTPDIVAAALVVEVFGREPDLAPEWLWQAMGEDLAGGLERLGRLSHDAEIVLALHDHRLSEWLARAVAGKPDRCRLVAPVVSMDHLPGGLIPLGAAVWRTLADVAEDEAGRAQSLNNLSVALADMGDAPGALAAIRDAVAIRRRLAAASPARYEPDSAKSLNNLSNALSHTGDAPGALAAIRDAVAIYRRLAAASPARYEPDLAGSLNNLSNALSDTGDAPGALAAIRDAVAIRRRLAAASPARYEPDLAGSLNTLCNGLSDAGDAPGALAAIRDAVAIYRRLAAASPARYEPDLAMSLHNLSIRLSDAGDAPGALAAIRDAVVIRRRLAAASPARYEPDLARSLNNLSNALSDTGDAPGALAAIRDAVAICRRLAAASPARYEPDLAVSLNNLSNALRDTGDAPGALAAIRDAVAIYRRLAASSPARYEPDLAMSLHNLSIHLSDAGDAPGALAAIRDAVVIRRRLAASSPARYEPDLGRSLSVLSDQLEKAEDNDAALDATEEAIRLIRPYAERFPGTRSARLLEVMQSDLARLKGGDGRTGSDQTK